VNNTSPETITAVVNDTIKYGYGLADYNPEGYNECYPSDLFLVMLFDDNNSFLGFHIAKL